MSELTALQKKFMRCVDACGSPDFPQLCTGWPDAEHGITWDAYCEWVKDTIDELEEGSDIGGFMSFAEWKREKREGVDEDLGFSRTPCDCCGSPLGGDRYAATLLPKNPAENNDYVALSVCQDCILYIANGDLPDDECLSWLA